MRAIAGLLVSTLILVVLVGFTWMHFKRTADSVELKAGPLIEQARKAQSASSEGQDSRSSVSMGGPLAQYMSKQDGAKSDSDKDKIETITYTPVASDHVGGSVVGSSVAILKNKFRLASVVDVPFEVPAHATMPQLHGTFRSFIQPDGKPSSDTHADVDFRLLNEEEFSQFVNGRPSEALFSADATHDQEVNATLPPTLNQPVKYHLVFVNDTRATKKVVQPDFRVDF
jgi:hypothetical protein